MLCVRFSPVAISKITYQCFQVEGTTLSHAWRLVLEIRRYLDDSIVFSSSWKAESVSV